MAVESEARWEAKRREEKRREENSYLLNLIWILIFNNNDKYLCFKLLKLNCWILRSLHEFQWGEDSREYQI